jgi:catechol 2,3-dioxygenase-like lactoylglutathione lyase family enzyme
MELNHVAVFVDDLDRSTLGPALGGWAAAARRITKQPAMTGGQRPAEVSGRSRRIRTADDRTLSLWVEDVEPEVPIQPAPGNAWHHVSLWCSDVPGTVRALQNHGYVIDLVGRGPNDEITTFAYMSSSSGPRVELTDARIRPRQFALFASEALEVTDANSESVPGAPFLPYEIAAVVENADELKTLSECWQRALGTEWQAVTDSSVVVMTGAGERELQTRSVKSAGSPCVTIIAPDSASRSLLTPVGGSGWHHVGLRSSDLVRDVASLKHSGFKMEFCDRGEEGRPHSFAMMMAPEGTRIKIATG